MARAELPVDVLGAARCRAVRDALLRAFGELGGQCAGASVLLAYLLRRDGVKARACCGSYRFHHRRLGEVDAAHVHVLMEGREILDPTGAQFGARALSTPAHDPLCRYRRDARQPLERHLSAQQVGHFLRGQANWSKALAGICAELACPELLSGD